MRAAADGLGSRDLAMKTATQPSRGRIAAAFAIAVLGDLAQLPVNVLYLSGALTLPGEALDLAIDGAVFAATSLLLGFHWALLPTLIVEAVPFADALPTWTLSVAFVVAQRKQAARAAAPGLPELPPRR